MAKISITLQASDVTKNTKSEILIIPQFSDYSNQKYLLPKFEQKINDRIEKQAKRVGFKAENGENFVVHDVDEKTTFDALLVFGLGKKSELTEDLFRETIATMLRAVMHLKFTKAALYIPSEIKLSGYSLGKAISEALTLAIYSFDTYMSADSLKKKTSIESFEVYGDALKEFEKGVAFGTSLANAVNFARDMVNEPGQYMYPEVLAKHAQDIAKSSKGAITVKVLSEAECRKLGMGSYLAVSQGSEYKPQFIVLHYKNTTKNKKSLCLIGKSITFDTGGLSIKPSKSMETMKLDMAGGAAVLGVFSLLAQNVVNTSQLGEIYGILPACENAVSAKSIRPGDIVKAMNGTSIEILNTDAEGRLALADALSYAEATIKPDYIIDLATLTGAIMVALGPDITGLFANDTGLQTAIEKAAKIEGETLWPMPLHKAYAKKMKSDVADLKNITGMGYGGAVTAALFLQEFVKTAKWAHLDIAGASFNEGGVEGTTPKGATGWGVRSMVRLIEMGI